jgi:phosphate/sulfate permease
VRWNIAKDIVIAWILTMPAAAGIGAAACAFVKAVG